MDKTNQAYATAQLPPADGEIDALAERLCVSWAKTAPGARGAGGQVLQRLAHGRVRAVMVETRRSKGRHARSRV